MPQSALQNVDIDYVVPLNMRDQLPGEIAGTTASRPRQRLSRK